MQTTACERGETTVTSPTQGGRPKPSREPRKLTPHRAAGMYNFDVLKYSIVVPFHNEEENVTELYDRLKVVLENTGEPFELVFVDDGSTDRTFYLLREIAAVDSRVVVVKLGR